MLCAYTKTRLEKNVRERFEQGQSAIVMIMMARYSIDMVKQMLKENYDYWSISAGKILDIYLAGYGAYLPSDKNCKDNQAVEGTDLYFSNKAFKTFKDMLYSDMGLQYDDRIEIFLVDYHSDRLHYNDALRIDVGESVDENQDNLRKLIAFLINACGKYSDIESLKKAYRLNKARKKVKSAVYYAV